MHQAEVVSMASFPFVDLATILYTRVAGWQQEHGVHLQRGPGGRQTCVP